MAKGITERGKDTAPKVFSLFPPKTEIFHALTSIVKWTTGCLSKGVFKKGERATMKGLGILAQQLLEELVKEPSSDSEAGRAFFVILHVAKRLGYQGTEANAEGAVLLSKVQTFVEGLLQQRERSGSLRFVECLAPEDVLLLQEIGRKVSSFLTVAPEKSLVVYSAIRALLSDFERRVNGKPAYGKPNYQIRLKILHVDPAKP